MITKKRLFKPIHKRSNRLVLAYTCESESLAVVPDSLVVTCTMDSTAIARMDSIHAADRIEPNPSIDPVSGLARGIVKGAVKGISKVAKSIVTSEPVQAIKEQVEEWWPDEDEDE